jgi:hypothetical protein
MPNDHYVPQFLLKNFSSVESKEQNQVWAFDKWNDKSFKTNTVNICAEHDFNFPEIESFLSQVEGLSKNVISTIIDKEQIGHLTKEDRYTLQVFIALQFSRTKNFRNMMKGLHEQFQSMLKENSEDESVEDRRLAIEDNDMKLFASDYLLRSLPELQQHLNNKEWVLYYNTFNDPLYCSDNPLIFHNSNDFGAYGNLGFAVKGIEIYLPLSPKFILAICCPSKNMELKNALANLKKTQDQLLSTITLSPRGYLVREQNKEYLPLIDKEINKGSERFEMIKKGLPLNFEFETLRFFNSLQVYYAERFVLSNIDDFSLARSYLKDFPHRKRGPRFEY